jgi:hypothetical protein
MGYIDDDLMEDMDRRVGPAPSPPESVLQVLTEFGQAEAAAILDAPDTRPDAAPRGTGQGTTADRVSRRRDAEGCAD